MEEDGVMLKLKDSDQLEKLTAGTTVWCTGIKMNPLANAVAAAMPAGQQACNPYLVCEQHHCSVRVAPHADWIES